MYAAVGVINNVYKQDINEFNLEIERKNIRLKLHVTLTIAF